MAAEDAAHYGSILPDGYHTGAGIPVDKTFHTFSGIIDAPDTETVNGRPGAGSMLPLKQIRKGLERIKYIHEQTVYDQTHDHRRWTNFSFA